jgi:prephenate dehydrogenase
MPVLFDKVVIVGVGLIGSSIGMNLVRKRMAGEVIGVGRDRANLNEAIRRRAIHRAVGAKDAVSLLAKLSENDLVILATPVRGIIHYLRRIAKVQKRAKEGPPPNLPPLIIDVGSTKSSVAKAATRHRVRFVGVHPIAGTEKSGAAAGELHLFEGKKCLLTPTRFCRKGDLRKVRRLWSELGSETIEMDPERHDRLLAAVSHLPHTIAFSLVSTVTDLVSRQEDLKFALGGLKGTTRVAASPPEMWHDIFLENRTFLLRAMDRYLRELRKLRSYILKKDSPKILDYLRKAQEMRLRFPD